MWDNCYLLHYYSHTKSPSKRGTLTHGPLNATGAWLIWYLIRVYIHVTLKWKRILFLVSQSQKHKTLAGFRRCKIWSLKRNVFCFWSSVAAYQREAHYRLMDHWIHITLYLGGAHYDPEKETYFVFDLTDLDEAYQRGGTWQSHGPLNT